MAGRTPEEKVERPVMLQNWRHVGFVHWRVDPDAVAPLLPDGLKPDLVDGTAWVSLTPFLVTGARPPGVPALPLISEFPETNLRTYVLGPDGEDGLWFFSIEVASLPTLLGARAAYGAPYYLADMSVDSEDGTTRYRSRRNAGQPAASHNIVLTFDNAVMGADRTEVDDLLTGRWRAYTQHSDGALLKARVQHQQWPLHRATVVELEETITKQAGLPPLGPPDIVHWSPGVDTKLSRPQRGNA